MKYILEIKEEPIVNLYTGNVKWFKTKENAQAFINKHGHKWKKEHLENVKVVMATDTHIKEKQKEIKKRYFNKGENKMKIKDTELFAIVNKDGVIATGGNRNRSGIFKTIENARKHAWRYVGRYAKENEDYFIVRYKVEELLK